MRAPYRRFGEEKRTASGYCLIRPTALSRGLRVVSVMSPVRESIGVDWIADFVRGSIAVFAEVFLIQSGTMIVRMSDCTVTSLTFASMASLW